MKIVLIQPPIQDFYETRVRLQPLGLAYLKAAARLHHPDVDIKILDFHQGWGRRTLRLPEELLYLKRYYPVPDESPFRTFHEYYHFGADFEELAEEVKKESPDLVGISSLFSPYYREVLKTADAIKQILEAPILIGGSHVSACPELMLSHPAVDFIIRGEGERAFVHWITAYKNRSPWSSVPNLGFKQNSRMILNPLEASYPVGELPFPDFSDLPAGRYLYEGRPMTFMMTSRGCPHHCIFCSVHQTFGSSFQRRSPHSILEEIRTRVRQGYQVIDFEDDNLTHFQQDMKSLCHDLIREFGGRIQFLAMNGISYLSLDDELLELMKQAGFTHLNLAFVSADPAVMRTANRPHQTAKFSSVVTTAFHLGLKTVSYQILGLPGETRDSMIETLVLQMKLPVLLGASPFYRTPGIPESVPFAPPSESDIFKARLSALAIETPEVARDDLYTFLASTRILNFLKGLSLDSPALSLEHLFLNLSEWDSRTRLGLTLLRRLFEEKRLFAVHAGRWTELPGFCAELFFNILKRARELQTLEGKTLKLA